ncbi:retrovirus-related pol polyprotein from transposon TNT 1-94 [Tanacetum coccineum]
MSLQIHQSPKGIFINQAKYALEILKKHNMDNCHSIGTPLAAKPKLDVDLSGEPVDQSDYRSKIGSLMYLTSSRPDLVLLSNGGDGNLNPDSNAQLQSTKQYMKHVGQRHKMQDGKAIRDNVKGSKSSSAKNEEPFTTDNDRNKDKNT